MQSGHLEIEDGVGMDRHYVRLPRVGYKLKRLVCIGSDGLVSLAALKWLAAQEASFVLLERNGRSNVSLVRFDHPKPSYEDPRRLPQVMVSALRLLER